jgi:hypothetical protein
LNSGTVYDDDMFATVSSGGDVNGDGYAEALFGAWGDDSGGRRRGAVYGVYGGW